MTVKGALFDFSGTLFRIESTESWLRTELYDALYDRHLEPAARQPYPDAAEGPAELHRHGVRIAVVSNIG